MEREKNSLYYIDDINQDLRKENNKLKQGIETDKIKLDLLKALHLDHMGVKTLNDSLKSKIINTIELIEENKELEEETIKNEKDIDAYIKELSSSSYITDEKIRIKKKTRDN